jgi:hypothetical protein
MSNENINDPFWFNKSYSDHGLPRIYWYNKEKIKIKQQTNNEFWDSCFIHTIVNNATVWRNSMVWFERDITWWMKRDIDGDSIVIPKTWIISISWSISTSSSIGSAKLGCSILLDKLGKAWGNILNMYRIYTFSTTALRIESQSNINIPISYVGKVNASDEIYIFGYWDSWSTLFGEILISYI